MPKIITTSFYSLPKQVRLKLVNTSSKDILAEISSGKLHKTLSYFGDEDTYIRKAACLCVEEYI
ncbi:MAG: hypothetical protein SGJ10_10825 [Bacteroidota bacterium]|nr:hypothetical protein [Bacteroidota bacterium]